MAEFGGLDGMNALPRAFDKEAWALGLERWQEAEDPKDAKTAKALAKHKVGARLLECLFGNSPFLGQVALDERAFFVDFARAGPDAAFETTLALLRRQDPAAEADAVMRTLRIAKRRAALAIALADIGGLWSLERVTGALSTLADAAVGLAVGHLLRVGHEAGHLGLPDPRKPETACGLAVLAMGKMGAHELNYSSDIDLILFYDEQTPTIAAMAAPDAFFVRLARGLVRLLQDRTEDGYAFRTDLRLRPDPGSTPLAIAMDAAEAYYESLGQNWERAAFIKARAAAGDLAAGRGFLSRLQPFVWRRNLDFAAIEDIQSIKRQIHRVKGHGRVAVAGHNIKLGRGGIREIEFFAQTQQLIAGGRDPRLRLSGTVATLEALVATGRIEAAAAAELADSYAFLRRIEHRLQMIEDHQTQTLPSDDKGLAHLACFAGFRSRDDFAETLRGHLERVEAHYARLFERAPSLGAEKEQGSLVFTGVEDDPETLRTIAALGFTGAAAVSATIRGWHHGRYRAMRSERARELLTALTPKLLAALAKTAEPDVAFGRFDEFLKNLPSGVQLFSLFYANPDLLEMLAQICGEAPRLAETLAGRASLLDAVITPGFFGALPEAAEMRAQLDEQLDAAKDMQDKLDAARRFARDMKFRIGVHVLRGLVGGAGAGRALAALADGVLARLLDIVQGEFAEQHGRIPGGAMVVLGMGKLGGREMTATSDLDLIFVFDHPKDAASDGKRSLAASHYFARLSQRFIAALTAPTAEGNLYEVDMRLRPSGKSGPIAVPLGGFLAYQTKEAWTWEHMALTRARVVAGPPELARRVALAVRGVLSARRDPAKLVADVRDMRERVARQHGDKDRWDLKHVQGGLLDIEFALQFLLLRDAARRPGILETNAPAAIAKLVAAGALDEASAAHLTAAHRLYADLSAVLRIAIDGKFDPETAPKALIASLVKIAGAKDLAALDADLAKRQADVRSLYDRLVALGATASPKPSKPERKKRT
jgi:glutamate-ammonia-ligase adenylyltransferase